MTSSTRLEIKGLTMEEVRVIPRRMLKTGPNKKEYIRKSEKSDRDRKAPEGYFRKNTRGQSFRLLDLKRLERRLSMKSACCSLVWP